MLSISTRKICRRSFRKGFNVFQKICRGVHLNFLAWYTCMGFRVWGFGIRVQGLGLGPGAFSGLVEMHGVEGLGCRNESFGFRVWGHMHWGLGFGAHAEEFLCFICLNKPMFVSEKSGCCFKKMVPYFCTCACFLKTALHALNTASLTSHHPA